ncbi:hypothetical protein V6N13_073108 [Hibiscus sabdariffa]
MTTRSFAKTFADIGLDNAAKGEKLGEIAEALKNFAEDKTPHLDEEVMSMEKKGFDDDFLCNVFKFLAKNEFEAKSFLARKTKHTKIWLQKFTQG